MREKQFLSTAEVAKSAGVHKDTLLRWLRSGLVPEPIRDRHGWRVFTEAEANLILEYSKSVDEVPERLEVQSSYELSSLKGIDWDFTNAKTSYLTHGIHPYPAKFIPQIPNALIQELSHVGDTVADIFCGSGTTLVEALTLKRHTVGIDANPLACLISKAKTSIITDDDAKTLIEVASAARQLFEKFATKKDGTSTLSKEFTSSGWRPIGKALEFWFYTHTIEELAECLRWCRSIESEVAKDLALVAFSSIVVAVSKQDSDTRYVRREKAIGPGETFQRFARALEQATRAAADFSELVEPRFNCSIIQGSLLQEKSIPKIDMVVCSPPYPNAFSYHLYHMTRMLWLEMDQPRFKVEEIGSHRKYSSNGKNAATSETFMSEFTLILRWLTSYLKKDGYACFVVGDSTLKGQRIDNAKLISEAGRLAGFQEVMCLERTLQTTRKAFNPVIGKIKTEKILILQNKGGTQ